MTIRFVAKKDEAVKGNKPFDPVIVSPFQPTGPLHIKISDIKVVDIMNLGSMLDAQDPCVRLKHLSYTWTTERSAIASDTMDYHNVL